MLLHQQKGAGSYGKVFGQLVLHQVLCIAIVGVVICIWRSDADAYEHFRTIRWHGSECCDSTEQEDSIGARIADPRKSLEQGAGFGQRELPEFGRQIGIACVSNSFGNLAKSCATQFGDHPTGFECARELCRCRREKFRGRNPDRRIQRLPALPATRFARGVATMPPNQELVRVGWPPNLL